MFDKLKQLKEMQNTLSQEREEVEKNGVKVVLNGKMQVEELEINSSLQKHEQERILKECINEAMKKLQMKIANKMSGMGFGL